MELNSAEAQQGKHQLIEVRKVRRDFASLNDYQIFRDELMSKCIHPWLRQAYQRIEASNVPHAIWGLIVCEKIDGVMNNSVLHAFEELYFWITTESTSSFENIIGFNEWVTQFNPTTWGDWPIVCLLSRFVLEVFRSFLLLSLVPLW